jgi:hypothetical protein
MQLAKDITKLDAMRKQGANRKDSRELLDRLQVNPQRSIGARVADQA